MHNTNTCLHTYKTRAYIHTKQNVFTYIQKACSHKYEKHVYIHTTKRVYIQTKTCLHTYEKRVYIQQACLHAYKTCLHT